MAGSLDGKLLSLRDIQGIDKDIQEWDDLRYGTWKASKKAGEVFVGDPPRKVALIFNTLSAYGKIRSPYGKFVLLRFSGPMKVRLGREASETYILPFSGKAKIDSRWIEVGDLYSLGEIAELEVEPSQVFYLAWYSVQGS